MAVRGIRTALAVAALATAALGPLPAGAETAALEIGTNLRDEACRALPKSADGGVAAFEIQCGPSQEPVGRVHASRLPDGAAPDAEAAFRRLADSTSWAQMLAQQARCAPPEWLAGGTGNAPGILVQTCRLRQGDWPYVGVSYIRDGRLVQAMGIPALAGLFLSRPPGLPAQAASAPDLGARLLERLEAVMGANALRYGPGDLQRYASLMDLGRLNNSLENFGEAETAYRQALELQTRALGDRSPALADALLSLALEVSNQGRADEADGLFRRAEGAIETSIDQSPLALLLSYRAFHSINSGRSDEALSLASQASALRRAEVEALDGGDFGGDGRGLIGNRTAARGNLVHGLLLEASVATRLGQYPLAIKAANEALDLYERTGGLPPWWHNRILGAYGIALAGGGRTAEGVRMLSLAVGSSRNLFGDGWIAGSTLLELGRVYAEDGQMALAIAAFRKGMAMVAADVTAPPGLPTERIIPYLAAAADLADKSPPDREALHREMFAVAQRIREGVTGQTIARAMARIATDDAALAELLRLQQDAARKRDRLSMDLAAETARQDRDAGREGQIRKELADAGAAVDRLRLELAERFPDYNRLRKTQPVSAEEVMRLLDPGEAMVTVVAGRTRSFGFVVDERGVQAYRIAPGAADIARRVAEIRKGVTPRLDTLPAFDLEASHALYADILGPVRERLAASGRIAMVPAGALSSLPPGLLVTETPRKPGAYAEASWLVREHAVTVAPSIPALVALRSNRARPAAPEPFVGFGAPSFKGSKAGGTDKDGDALDRLRTACLPNGPLDPELLRSLTPLPETEREVRSVAKALRASDEAVLVGGGVTKAALRGRDLSRFKVVYFATHGLLPGELRCQAEPGLALSPPASRPADTADDGLLRASEITAFRLNANLVVLSACNTAGASGAPGGEALSGLAEAFFFAGARAVLVSHWKVPSAETATLMTTAFQKLGDRTSGVADPAAALAESQRALALQGGTAHPFYWAAFTLVGDAPKF